MSAWTFARYEWSGKGTHYMLILGLMMIVRTTKMLVKTITAFTVAHSITLGLATFGVVHLPPAPTEAIIALSILFLAAEIVHKRQGQVGITERWPWIIAFIFGLFEKKRPEITAWIRQLQQWEK